MGRECLRSRIHVEGPNTRWMRCALPGGCQGEALGRAGVRRQGVRVRMRAALSMGDREQGQMVWVPTRLPK
eukprot:253736-Chlamydomonas_euryale.AAC.2